MPQGNTALKAERDGRLVADDFRHEQYLIVTEGDTTVLFSGCAHRGL
jgi:7,8-dihydropterin-6-yl-methyl-4-(beta-D-ribofuranosyl)aminobenzene 5'-phosphate synthase